MSDFTLGIIVIVLPPLLGTLAGVAHMTRQAQKKNITLSRKDWWWYSLRSMIAIFLLLLLLFLLKELFQWSLSPVSVFALLGSLIGLSFFMASRWRPLDKLKRGPRG